MTKEDLLKIAKEIYEEANPNCLNIILCDDCHYCENCSFCKGLKLCNNCINCINCYNCIDCKDCIDCKGLINKQYYISNIKYTKKKYESIKNKREIKKLMKEFYKIIDEDKTKC